MVPIDLMQRTIPTSIVVSIVEFCFLVFSGLYLSWIDYRKVA
jgi:hypothetical protein